jgi:NodT family efflux transporter outer membrane factor (OMF) lipoprotein
VKPFVPIALLVALAGCAVGPDFVAPAKPDVDRYVADDPTRADEVRDVPADWWTLFRSPQLTALVEEALAHSPDIASAEAALRAANETALAQQGAFFPTLDAEYSPTRQSVSQVFSNPLNSSTYLYTLHTTQLSIGYVPDLFGGNRRQLESLVAQAEAQRDTLIAARLTLTTNVVVAAIQQASLRSQLRAAREVVAIARRQLDLYRRSQSLGQSGSADIAAQETGVAQALAAVPPLEKQLAQQGSLLAVLTGRLPADPSAAQDAFDVGLDALPLPVDVPSTLPSSLVDQRPDVRIATEQLHAASALIGVAVANRLPNLSLTATGGSQALSLSRLFSAGTGFWSLGAGLTQPLFDGGTLLHRERAARANYDQAAARYRGTVLVAFQNVSDALTAIEADRRAFDAALAAEEAARRSLAITTTQQSAGAGGVLPVLTAEQAWRQAVMSRLQTQAARLSDTVALMQALGGGWWNDSSARSSPPCAASDTATCTR